jgi:hypothetical protein
VNVADTLAVAEIINGCKESARVSWLVNGGPDVLSGVMRSVGDEQGRFLGDHEDVLGPNVYVRITATFEHFLPIQDVVDMLRNGTMAIGWYA